MAINTSPIYTKARLLSSGQVTTLNPYRTSTNGTRLQLHTSGSDGDEAAFLVLQAIGPTAPDVIRLWLYNTSTTLLMQEIAVPQTSGEPLWRMELPTGFGLPAGYRLELSTHNGQTYNAFLFAGSYTA